VQAAVEELDKAESQGGGLAGVFTSDKIPLSGRKLGSYGLWPGLDEYVWRNGLQSLANVGDHVPHAQIPHAQIPTSEP
jgi:hypothetical protein